MRFFAHMIPPTVTHQQKKLAVRNGKPIHYEDARLTDARAKLMAHLGQHVPSAPLTGPLRVSVKWCFPVSEKYPHGTWRTKTPDTHNLSKLLFDVMTDLGFWPDDKWVVSENIEKIHWDKPGIFVEIIQIEPSALATRQTTQHPSDIP